MIAVVGGGFSGSMVLCHLCREARGPLHVVMFERQAEVGLGVAYATTDERHLLNVPAANMSAYPATPGHFLDWARGKLPEVAPYDFLPRKMYGQYLQACIWESRADANVTVEVKSEEVTAIEKSATGFVVNGVPVDVVVLATGHRPPQDPLARSWRGSRERFIGMPWTADELGAIAPNQSVVLLGTGLTAMDVVLTLGSAERTAPIVALSRRGLLPEGHAEAPVVARDPRAWLEPLLSEPLTTRKLLGAVRRAVKVGAAEGGDWRAVIDGLRPHLPSMWRALPEAQAARFLEHLRAFWEVRRHRMAPSVTAKVQGMVGTGRLKPMAARLLAAEGRADGVVLEVRRRGQTESETIRTDWVVNCTGPGAGPDAVGTPVVRSLVAARQAEIDGLGLGVLTTPEGFARVGDVKTPGLLVVGTLRKPDLWESTAVPELRVQAAQAARAALA